MGANEAVNKTESYKDDSFVNEEMLRGSMIADSNVGIEAEAKKFNNQLGATNELPQEEDKNSSIPEEVKDEEYDEYRDDDFEQISQNSITMNNQVS